MEGAQGLAQQQPAEQRGEYGHQVHDHGCPARADDPHAMVPANVGHQRGEHGGVADGGEVARREGEAPYPAQFQQVERQDQRQTEQHQHAQQHQRRHQQMPGPATQQQRIERPGQHGEQHDEVAALERQAGKGLPAAATDQVEQPARRHSHAEPGAAQRPFAEQEARADKGGQRQAGIHQGKVDRLGALRGGIEQRVVAGDAHGGEHWQAPAGCTQGGAVGPDALGDERQQQAGGQHPAPERQAERRDAVMKGAADQGVAAPAEHGDKQPGEGRALARAHQAWRGGRRRYCEGNWSSPLTVTLRFFHRPSLMP